MKFRALLLGTAAAFATVGGAQAADLAVADPIDYVKVCDAFPGGYHYIPGTDTCLRIGGYVQFKAEFGEDIASYDDPNEPGTGPTGDYNFQTEAGFDLTAKWMSDWGQGTVFMAFLATDEDTWASTGDTSGDFDGTTNQITRRTVLDKAYFQIAGWLFGYTDSVVNGVGGFTDNGGFRSDIKTTQISYHVALGGWGLHFGIEEGRTNRWGESWDAEIPDLTFAITGGGGGWTWKATAAYTDRVFGDGYGFGIGGTADLGVFDLAGNFAWSHDAPSFVANGITSQSGAPEGDWMSALLSISVDLGATTKFVATGSWRDGPAGGNVDTTWLAAAGFKWAVTTNVSAFLEAEWSETNGNDAWKVTALAKAAFGG